MDEQIKKEAIEAEVIETKEDEVIEPVDEENKPKPDEEEKKDEPKKEWAIVRGFKAIGRGASKAVHAVGNAIDKHPRIAVVLSSLASAGATYGVMKLLGGDDDEPVKLESTFEMDTDEPAALPEVEEIPMLQDYEEAADMIEPETVEPTETISE